MIDVLGRAYAAATDGERAESRADLEPRPVLLNSRPYVGRQAAIMQALGSILHQSVARTVILPFSCAVVVKTTLSRRYE